MTRPTGLSGAQRTAYQTNLSSIQACWGDRSTRGLKGRVNFKRKGSCLFTSKSGEGLNRELDGPDTLTQDSETKADHH